MPRHQWDDGDDDYRERPHPRPPANLVLVIALVVGGVLLVGAAACGGLAVFRMQSADRVANEQAAIVAEAEGARVVAEAKAKAAKVYTRDEFRDLVLGKTPGEVRTLLGPPKKESESPKRVVWHYQERTTDPATSKLDREAQVIFENDRVVRIDY
jgi:hypothetical protein